jgi:hypothetical protein
MAAYTAIDDPTLYFSTTLWTGNGVNDTEIVVAGTGMQPDMIWVKKRTDDASDNVIIDDIRGVNKILYPNTTEGQTSESAYLNAFNSDGFDVGTAGRLNADTDTYVGWTWKESATAGFDMLSYTGNGTDDTDISHNLSAVPKMIIIKNYDAVDPWQIYHAGNTAAPETDYMVLNTTAATADAADRWSDEAPTSSVFTLGDAAEVNTNTENYIAYLFAEKQGFSKFGSYEGNGNADGTFVYTGFRPAWLLIKKSSGAGNSWEIYDNKRLGYNVDNNNLRADGTDTEFTDDRLDILSNGFKVRATSTNVNGSGSTYIYMCFAEASFVNSNGVPCNAR